MARTLVDTVDQRIPTPLERTTVHRVEDRKPNPARRPASRRALQQVEPEGGAWPAVSTVEDATLPAAVLDALDDAVVVVDRDGRLVRANAAATAILGASGATGQWWGPLAARQSDGSSLSDVGAAVLRTGEGVRGVDVSVDRGDGTTLALSVNCHPLRLAGGPVTGLVLGLCDVTGDAHPVVRLTMCEQQPDAGDRDPEPTAARDVLQTTVDSLPAHVAVLDQAGGLLTTNRAWKEFGAANGGSSPGTSFNYLEVCDAAGDDEHALRAATGLRAVAAGAQDRFAMEYPCHHADAQQWFRLRAARFDGPGPARMLVSHVDVTDGHRAERQIRTQAALLDEITVAVIATDLSRTVTYWNQAAEQLYGWTRREAVGRSLDDLLVAVQPAGPDRAACWLDSAGDWEGDILLRRRDGSAFPAEVRKRVTVDADGRASGLVTVSTDITERVASERDLQEAKDYMRAVADCMGQGLLTLDIDGCVSYVNPAAEALLDWSHEQLGGRPMTDLTMPRSEDGTDVPPWGPTPAVTTVRAHDAVFVRRDGVEIPVAYTVAPFETEAGIQGHVVVFEDISERKAYEDGLRSDAETLAWIGRIQEALADDRFELHAQPIIDLQTREVSQRELLIRMRDEDGSMVAPCAFLPVAEKYALIGDIDRWVIEQAAALAATGRRVEINISARSVGDPAVIDHLERCLQTSGADPSLLVVEITETALVEDEAAAVAFAERIHALGIRLALDDFGTGYGTFTYLKHLPVDFLKIDIEFVRDLATNRASHHVVEAVVALAHAFGIQTIAEGVEDAATLELLVDLGVDFAQGYFIGRPGPLAAGDTGKDSITS